MVGGKGSYRRVRRARIQPPLTELGHIYSRIALVFGGASVIGRLKPYIPTALFALLIFYFGCQALTGDRGVLTAPRREEALAARRRELAQLQAERSDLEMQVRLLSDDHLSKDLLDERARELLGFTHPNEYVVRLPHPAD